MRFPSQFRPRSDLPPCSKFVPFKTIIFRAPTSPDWTFHRKVHSAKQRYIDNFVFFFVVWTVFSSLLVFRVHLRRATGVIARAEIDVPQRDAPFDFGYVADVTWQIGLKTVFLATTVERTPLNEKEVAVRHFIPSTEFLNVSISHSLSRSTFYEDVRPGTLRSHDGKHQPLSEDSVISLPVKLVLSAVNMSLDETPLTGVSGSTNRDVGLELILTITYYNTAMPGEKWWLCYQRTSLECFRHRTKLLWNRVRPHETNFLMEVHEVKGLPSVRTIHMPGEEHGILSKQSLKDSWRPYMKVSGIKINVEQREAIYTLDIWNTSWKLVMALFCCSRYRHGQSKMLDKIFHWSVWSVRRTRATSPPCCDKPKTS